MRVSDPPVRGRVPRVHPVVMFVMTVVFAGGVLATSVASAAQTADSDEPATEPSEEAETSGDASSPPVDPAVESSTSSAEQPLTTAAPSPVLPEPGLVQLRPVRNMGELSVFAGPFVASEAHELYDPKQPWERVRPGAAIGIRGGFYPFGFAGFELEGGVTPLRTGSRARATMYFARAHAVFQLPLFSVAPFALIGGGMLGTTGALGFDIDPAFHFGGGVKMYTHRFVGFRVDGRGLLMTAYTREANRTVHGEMLFSVVVTLGRPARDSDGDGLPDPGQRAKREDACPMIAGLASLRGCPDLDGDGLTDADDICPSEPGPKQRLGCPGLIDSDGDGYFDPRQHDIPEGKVDRCPGLAGVPEYTGCPVPDTDEDGFDDLHDACIDKPENTNGYEDDDGCPDEIPRAVRQIIGTIQGINFNFLSADLTRDSLPIIERAAKVLGDFPTLRMEVQGHTDSDGDSHFNHELSRKRAEAVRRELIKAGVADSRITAVGYGGDKPKASNDTEAGRANNRRIEFRLLDENGLPLEVDGAGE